MEDIKFVGSDKSVFSVSDDELGVHTLFIGGTGRGRSALIEAHAKRQGISYDEAEKSWLLSDVQLQAEADRERLAQVKRDQRTAAVREAYWSATDAESGEFDALYDVLNDVCERDPTDGQVRKLFDMLPADVIGEGVKYGFTDTVVGDAIHVFVQENKHEVVANVFAE